jgi:thiamine biosynthesis lipoprotein
MSKETYMQSMRGLGTDIELRLLATSIFEAEKIFAMLWEEIRAFEARFSRFLSSSELSQSNERAGEKVPISKQFKDILEVAKSFGEVSDGMFNPFILPCLQRSGYLYSMVAEETDAPDFSKRKMAKIENLEIGEDWMRIPEDAIDLGGIGKGYVADHLASLLIGTSEGFCFSLGGDIVARGFDETGKPWNITIQSAENREEDSAFFTSTLEQYGVATSGYVRDKDGKVQEHQINPTSHIETDTTYDMCSVAAKNATTADVFASCILLGGKKYAEKYVKEGIVDAVFLQGTYLVEPLLLGKGFTLKES